MSFYLLVIVQPIAESNVQEGPELFSMIIKEFQRATFKYTDHTIRARLL